MALIRFQPMTEFEVMQRQMDRMLTQVLGQRHRGLPRMEEAMAFTPNVEVFEHEHEIVLNAELPGLDPDKVSLEVTEDAVQITGELKCSDEIQEDAYYHTERTFGAFRRIIPLPGRINDQEAKATFRNGLLTLRAPLVETPKKIAPHKVQIET